MGIPLDRGAFIIGCIVCAQRIRGRLRQEVMEDWFLTSGWCHWSVLTSDCGIVISSTSYSGFDLSLVQLIAWAEDAYIGLTLRLFLVSTTLLDTEHCKAHSLQVMRTQLETLGEEFKLAGKYLMERTYYALRLDLEMHWHCEDNGHIWASYLSESFVMRCFGIVRTIPTSSSSWPMDHTLDLMVCFLSFLRWLWLSLWGRHCFEKNLVYIVDWLLQWSKDFSDTTVFGWPTLTMSNRTFYSTLRLEAVRCYLYVENWFGERTLCSDYVLYTEEGCTDTLCESLRSWEVSQLVTNELVIHVWMRTSLLWELLEVFRWFWIHLVKLSFVDF